MYTRLQRVVKKKRGRQYLQHGLEQADVNIGSTITWGPGQYRLERHVERNGQRNGVHLRA